MVKYVLTGATGGLGSVVFNYLIQNVPASDIIVSLYNPAGASKEITESGVEIRHGDFSKPETLDAAFSGGDKLLIVSHPSYAYESKVKLHTAAIDAAKRAGIKHVYYTSAALPDGTNAFLAKAHIATEAHLRDSGLTYTIVREGLYSEVFPMFVNLKNPVPELSIPYGDGGVAWASRDDLALGTAKLLISDGYENKTVLLTGSVPVTFSEIVAKVNEISHRDPPLVIKIVSEEQYRAQLSAVGVPEGLINVQITSYYSVAHGELAVVDPLLENLLGRKTKPIEETIREVLSEGKGI